MPRLVSRLVFTCVVLLISVPIQAQPADSIRALWQEGTQAYAQGRYQQATEAYQQVVTAGFESGALHYNIGNAYYRLGEMGEAVQHYEKAKRFRPGDARIEHNLDMVRSQFDTLNGAVPAPTWLRMLSGWSIPGLFWVGLIAYTTGFLAWSWFRSSLRLSGASSTASSAARPLSLVAAGAGLLLILLAGAADYAQTLDRRAVVLVEQASLQAEPDAGANPAADVETDAEPGAGPADGTTLIEGTIVRLHTTRSGWTRVTVPNGGTGWLPTSAIGGI